MKLTNIPFPLLMINLIKKELVTDELIKILYAQECRSLDFTERQGVIGVSYAMGTPESGGEKMEKSPAPSGPAKTYHQVGEYKIYLEYSKIEYTLVDTKAEQSTPDKTTYTKTFSLDVNEHAVNDSLRSNIPTDKLIESLRLPPYMKKVDGIADFSDYSGLSEEKLASFDFNSLIAQIKKALLSAETKHLFCEPTTIEESSKALEKRVQAVLSLPHEKKIATTSPCLFKHEADPLPTPRPATPQP